VSEEHFLYLILQINFVFDILRVPLAIGLEILAHNSSMLQCAVRLLVTVLSSLARLILQNLTFQSYAMERVSPGSKQYYVRGTMW